MAKLMLVEDDNNLREIYEARLRAEGYDIVSARDGEEALVVAKSEKPDLIIADIMMPKISGFEMLDILRNTADLKNAKVIMLTALGQSDDQQRANSLGADRYLVKSQVTLEDIIKVVHELLGDNQAEGAAPAETATPPAPAVSEPAAAPAEPEPTEPADSPPTATTIPVSAEPPEAPAADAGDNVAQSAAQEEAGVESQIEDFVAGATEEPAAAVPTVPTDAPMVTDDGTTAGTDESAESDAKSAADAADDDKLVADAAQALIDSTEDKNEDAASGEPVIIAPEPAASEPGPAAEAEAEPQAKSEDNTSVPIAHKKIISPLDDQPKEDIKTLLAKEEAKEASADPTAGSTIKPSEPPAGPESGNPADPGSIAL